MAGLSLVNVVHEDSISAAKALASRPGGREIVAAVVGKRIGHVVALKLDRLFRDAVDALNQTRAWDRPGSPPPGRHEGPNAVHGGRDGADVPDDYRSLRGAGTQPDLGADGGSAAVQEIEASSLRGHPLWLFAVRRRTQSDRNGV